MGASSDPYPEVRAPLRQQLLPLRGRARHDRGRARLQVQLPRVDGGILNPQRLRARGFGSFEELDLDMPAGLASIVGENGAGKSTLVRALEGALFGPNGRSFA